MLTGVGGSDGEPVTILVVGQSQFIGDKPQVLAPGHRQADCAVARCSQSDGEDRESTPRSRPIGPTHEGDAAPKVVGKRVWNLSRKPRNI